MQLTAHWFDMAAVLQDPSGMEDERVFCCPNEKLCAKPIARFPIEMRVRMSREVGADKEQDDKQQRMAQRGSRASCSTRAAPALPIADAAVEAVGGGASHTREEAEDRGERDPSTAAEGRSRVLGRGSMRVTTSRFVAR